MTDLWIWRGVDLAGCGYGGVWMWRGVDVEGCGFGGMWIWLSVDVEGCGYGGVGYGGGWIWLGVDMARGVDMTVCCWQKFTDVLGESAVCTFWQKNKQKP